MCCRLGALGVQQSLGVDLLQYWDGGNRLAFALHPLAGNVLIDEKDQRGAIGKVTGSNDGIGMDHKQ